MSEESLSEPVLVVVFRRRRPVPKAQIASENSRGEAMVGAVMETVQRTLPKARVVSLSRDVDLPESLTLFFVGVPQAAEADLRRAIRSTEMPWTGRRTCLFSDPEALHERLKLEFKPYQDEGELTEEQRRASTHAHLEFLRQLGLPGWFLDQAPEARPSVTVGES
jgi:hypothetical protein